jgi:hypothetical protein
MMLARERRRHVRLTTLLAAGSLVMLAGCVTTEDDASAGANRPPCTYPCQQPTVIQPRKTAVSATPKVKPKT